MLGAATRTAAGWRVLLTKVSVETAGRSVTPSLSFLRGVILSFSCANGINAWRSSIKPDLHDNGAVNHGLSTAQLTNGESHS